MPKEEKEDDSLSTEKTRAALAAIVEDLENDIESTFSGLEEPINDINETLESKFLKRFLVEFGKLKIRLTEKLPEELATCIVALEEHDAAIEAAFEELIAEEEEGG